MRDDFSHGFTRMGGEVLATDETRMEHGLNDKKISVNLWLKKQMGV